MKRLALALVLLITALTRTAHAADWTIDLTKSGNDVKAVSHVKSRQTLDKAQLLTVTCDASLDCANVTVKAGDASLSPATTSKTSMTVSIDPKPSTVRVFYGTQDMFNISVSTAAAGNSVTPNAAAAGDPGGQSEGSNATLSEMLSTPCHFEGTLGPREVVVSPLGAPLSPLPDRFAENETLTVTVLADARLIPMLTARRKSSIRVVSGVKILGADTKLPALDRQAVRETSCDTRQFPLSDFADGTGEVEVAARVGDTTVTLGGFQFLVDPVYSGMFSLGAVWTPLLSPDFTVATRGGQDVIVQSETGSRRLAYTFMYTPFLWDGLERDVRKSTSWKNFYRHINPSVGFVLNDPLDNVLIGGTIDFGAALLVNAGAIFSNVKELDGVAAGDVFTGTSADLPTHKVWKHDWFVGASVDLRAAVQLLRAVLGTTTGS